MRSTKSRDCLKVSSIVQKERDAGGVAGRPSKARDESVLDRVRAAHEHDWYCRCGFSRVRSHVAANRQQQIWLFARQRNG